MGEILSLARKFDWGDAKKETLTKLLGEIVTVDINQPSILEAYGELDYFREKVCKPAKAIGQNDLWIAATGMCTGAILVTTDADFEPFEGKFITLIRVPVQAPGE